MNHPQNNTNTPLYRQVEHYIVSEIDSGRLTPGDLIPSEPQLSSLLNVSQGTVKKALDNLVNEKRLYRHQGKGTYVSTIDFNNSLFRFFSYGDAAGKSVRIHKEVNERAIKAGPKAVCHQLGYEADAKLLYIQRSGYIRELPILVEHCWWCPELLPGLENAEVHIPDLMYAMVVETYGVPVVRSEETLTADIADKQTAQILNIPEKSPVIVLIRHTFSSNNKMIEYRKTIGRADKFSYKAEIR
jgi:GntR family transcriptional regulator